MSKTYLDNQAFFKSNYNEALNFIVPKYLIEDDINNFGKEVDLVDQIINSHITLASSISSVINVSSQPGSTYSSINTFRGIAPYFVKQNNLTVIRPEYFERKVLDVLGRSFVEFETSSQLASYVNSTLLPAIRLNSPTGDFTHSGLIRDLSWMYLLNTSGQNYSPSAFVSDLIVNKLYNGTTVYLNDCINGLTEHIWKNGFTSLYPNTFASSTGTYTSGTQQLDKLKTWVDIIYSPLYADSSDFTVKERFELFLTTGLRIEDEVPAGPISKLVRMLSFAAFDINNDTELIDSLYNIQDCPDKYLPYVADLIGWRLFGSNPEKWRLQLRNAVEVYKRVGTKKAIQFALNTVFPKDIFSIESRLTELWESYIPYLIYYALATESDYLKSQEVWTRQQALSMGVVGYSNSSLDENIRLVVDKIIHDTYLKFKSSFNIPNIANGFFFRGRNFPLPPFEEYPYYVNVELSDSMIDFIADRLACFGVRNDFAIQLRDYVKENTVDVDDQPRSNSWLFFTSGYNYPPNLDNLAANINLSNFEYTSLWSGKSSHFKLVFDASEFDFSNKNELDPQSGDAVAIASDIVNEFSPAHSIPLVSLQLSSADSTLTIDANLPIIDLKTQERLETSKVNSNYYTSGLHLNAYTRNNTSGNKFGRSNLNNIDGAFFTSKSPTGSIPRNSIRRRSYENSMPMYGYYDRTGFNMPVSFDMSASLSGFPLGYIPSSLSFVSITDYTNLPAVYTACINSSSNVYGYNVSSTLKCRGHLPLSSIDYYTDRGQLPDIYSLMHSIGEKQKYYVASSLLPSATLLDLSWKNVYQSFANSATEVSGWFPSSTRNFYDFKFGRDFHQLYRIYTKEFDRHRMAEDLQYLDGPNIFSHTFGPLLFNNEFDKFNQTFATTNLSSVYKLTPGDSVFSTSGSSYGTYIVSSTSSLKLYGNEFVNSGILSGVELVHTSGYGQDNYFSIVKFSDSLRSVAKSDYMFGKTFLAMKGLVRARFDLRAPTLDSSEGYPIQKNFLLPEHKYKLKLKFTNVSNDGLRFGGTPISVWIHTKLENSKVWSYSVNGNWEEHGMDLDRAELASKYFHTITSDEIVKNPESESQQSQFKCIELTGEAENAVSPMYGLVESDFNERTVEFNTNNRTLLFDRAYGLAYGQVHRKTQDYVIEILKPQTDQEKVLLLDSVDLVNLTMNKMSQIPTINTCPDIRIPLSKSDLQSAFRFFNDISGKNSAYGIASRDSTETSGIMFNSGGSRLDYRVHPDTCTAAAGGSIYYAPLGTNLVISDITLPL